MRRSLEWVGLIGARFEQSNLFETAAILREIYKLNLCNFIEFIISFFNDCKISQSICIYQISIILEEKEINSTVNNYPRQNTTSIRISSRINISKVFIRISRIFKELNLWKIRSFKASPKLINSNKLIDSISFSLS